MSQDSAPRLSRELARALALDAGFTEAGLTALPIVDEQQSAERFEQWLQAGRAASMSYLERRSEDGRLLRSRVSTPFPWARSAIVCWASYNHAQPRSIDAAEASKGWIARYACSSRTDAAGVRRPSDYHKVLLKRLKLIEARLHQHFGNFEARAFVDTGPLVERNLAEAAGLGWTGKNTCTIHPQLGSYGFLAVLLTSLEAEKTVAVSAAHCGSCRRCLDACPAGALIAPYQLDAARCIAYLTIEHRGAIAPEQMEGIGRQVFGCDICQEVCPWNRKALLAADPELSPRPELLNPALDWLASLDESEFEKKFNGSPVRRAGFSGLRRNGAIAMGNSGLTRFTATLEAWSAAADEGLRSAALWAINKLKK